MPGDTLSSTEINKRWASQVYRWTCSNITFNLYAGNHFKQHMDSF